MEQIKATGNKKILELTQESEALEDYKDSLDRESQLLHREKDCLQIMI
jgi:hypothetical protein